MDTGAWEAISAIATAVATIVALGVVVHELVLRRKREEADRATALRDRQVEILRELQRIFLGRLSMTESSGERGGPPNKESFDRRIDQYRSEQRVFPLVQQLPPEYTALIRRSETHGQMYAFNGAEREAAADPWRDHPDWDSRQPIHPSIIAADLEVTIHSLLTGEPKQFPEFRPKPGS